MTNSLFKPKKHEDCRPWAFLAAALLLTVSALLVSWFGFFQSMTGGLSLLYKEGFFFAIALCILGFLLFRRQVADYPEKLFLVITLVLTCSFSWMYDTNEVSWDIQIHYAFMLEYADPDRNHEYTEADDAITKLSVSADENDLRMQHLNQLASSGEGIIGYDDNRIWIDTKSLQTKDELLNELDEIKDDTNRMGHGPLSALYKRMANLPASAVFMICSVIGVPFVVKYILAKLAYALIYSFVLYFGMRKLRSGKMLFAAISLCPTAMFLAETYSYDYWVNAWCMYAVASIVGQLQNPESKSGSKDLAKIIIGFFIGLGPKAIYFPLMLLCLLIPRTKFVSSRQCTVFRTVAMGVMLVVVASFAAPFLIVPSSSAGDSRGGSDVSSIGQIGYILSNPLEYALTLTGFLFSFLSPVHAGDYIINLAYLGIGPMWVCVVVYLLILFTTITDTHYVNPTMNNWKHRLFVIVVILGTLVLAVTALYVSFTPVGADHVAGFQGRYIIPLLFPFLIFMGTKKTSWPAVKSHIGIYNMSILAVMAFMNYFITWNAYVGLLS